MRVALVNMPFAATDRPSLAIGLLQAVLRKSGFECSSKHYNILFSRLLDDEPYRQLSDGSSSVVLAGEWVFSQIYYGQTLSKWQDYEREILSNPVWGLPSQEHVLVQKALQIAPQFLRLAFESCSWEEFDVVGFTSMFEQTMPSMCLARMIKSAVPSITIVVGGANFEADMGPPYLDLFPMIDYVCVGEGEAAIVELCRALAAKSGDVPAGIVSRGRREVPLPDSSCDLDSLPYPDFDDFFAASRRSGRRHLAVTVEASRGCWWGEKSHCTFCGLNGRMMRYRQKTSLRVIQEVEYLEKRYEPDVIQFTDNILSREHGRSVLPVWARSPGKAAKFFETKANITREELRLIGQAGVTCIQPGIESFSDTTLRVMGKGVLAAHNIALLRWGIELGISVRYNVIFGFPKEALADYDSMLDLLHELTHLNPPEACSPIRMDRFSPNYSRYRSEGFTEVKPMPAYRHVFAANDVAIQQLAYYFEYRHAHSDRLLELGSALMQFIATWRAAYESGSAGTFSIVPDASGRWRLLDTRFNRSHADLTLNREEVAIAVMADKPIGTERVLRSGPGQGMSCEVAGAVLEKLLSLGIIRRVGERLVTLPMLPDSVRVAFTEVPSSQDREVTWLARASSS
jgi:ribosomal peptide maturation radical SAM protein 1